MLFSVVRFNQMSASATFSSRPDDKNDDFGDFEMPDLSVSETTPVVVFKHFQDQCQPHV
jgi:hypothetical protein